MSRRCGVNRLWMVCMTVALAWGKPVVVSAAPAPGPAPPPPPKATKPPKAPASPNTRASASASASAAATPGKILVAANNHYAYGRYETVVKHLRPIVERGLLKRQADRLEALRLYGICLHLTGRMIAAAQVFRTLIDQAPQTRLDPRIVQPEVVAAFERIRQPRLRRLRDLARRAREKKRDAARRSLSQRWGILNLIPMAGQFQNGHWKKGLVVLSIELTMLAANLTSYYLLRSTGLRQPDGTFVEKDADGNVVHDRRKLAKALMGINYASLGLLLGTLVYGMVDGFVYHFRRNRGLRRIIERPLSVTPLPVPGGAGVSFSLKF